MPKILIRIVAFLLAFCLIADPSFSSAWQTNTPISNSFSLHRRTTIFEQEALTLLLTHFPRRLTPNAGPTSNEYKTEHAAASALGKVYAQTAHRWEWLFQAPVALHLILGNGTPYWISMVVVALALAGRVAFTRKLNQKWTWGSLFVLAQVAYAGLLPLAFSHLPLGNLAQTLIMGLGSSVIFAGVHRGRSRSERLVLGVLGFGFVIATALPISLLHPLPVPQIVFWAAGVAGTISNIFIHRNYNTEVLEANRYPLWFSNTLLHLIPKRFQPKFMPIADALDLPHLQWRIHNVLAGINLPDWNLLAYATWNDIKTLKAFNRAPDVSALQIEASTIIDQLEKKRAAWLSGEKTLENLPTIAVAFINFVNDPEMPQDKLEDPITLDKLIRFYDVAWDKKALNIRENWVFRFQGTVWRDHHFRTLAVTKDIEKSSARSFIRQFIQDVIHQYQDQIQSSVRPQRIIPRPLSAAGRWEAVLQHLPSPERAAAEPFIDKGPITPENIRERLKDIRVRRFALPSELEDISTLMARKKAVLKDLQTDANKFAHYRDLVARLEARAAGWDSGDYRIENAPPAVRALINRLQRSTPYKLISGLHPELEALPMLSLILDFCARCDQALLNHELENEIEVKGMIYLFKGLWNTVYFNNQSKPPSAKQISDYAILGVLQRDVYHLIHYYISNHEEDILKIEKEKAADDRYRSQNEQEHFYLATFTNETLEGRDRSALEYLARAYYQQPGQYPELSEEVLFDIYDDLDQEAQSGFWPNQPIAVYLDKYTEQTGSLMDFLIHRTPTRSGSFTYDLKNRSHALHEFAPIEFSTRLSRELNGFFANPNGALRFATFSEWFFLKRSIKRFSSSDEWPAHTAQMCNDILQRINEREATWQTGSRRWETLPTGAAAFIHFVIGSMSTRTPFPTPPFYGKPITLKEVRIFRRKAVDTQGRLQSVWKERYKAALLSNISNEWVADFIQPDLSNVDMLFSEIESLIRSEHDQQELETLIAADATVVEELPAERVYDDLSSNAIDLLWRVTLEDPGARKEAELRLTPVFGPNVIAKILNYVETLNEPIDSMQDFNSNPIPGIELSNNIDKMILALGLPDDQRRKIESAFPEAVGQFRLSDWSLLVHLLSKGFNDLALLRVQVPDLLIQSHYGDLEPRLQLLKLVRITPNQESQALTTVLGIEDLDTLGFIIDMSGQGLTFETLLSQFHALSSPVSAPPIVTTMEYERASGTLNNLRARYDRGSMALSQGLTAEARNNLNEAFIGLGKLIRETEAILEQAITGDRELPQQEEWLDLYSNASNLQESVALLSESIPAQVTVAEKTPQTAVQASRFHAVPGEPVTVRRKDGVVFKVYINRNYAYFDTDLFKQLREDILKELIFYIDNPRHPSSQESGPMSNIRRVKVMGNQYRAYVYTLEPHTILIHAFGSTAKFKADGMALKINFKNEMIRRNDWKTTEDVSDISIEPWIYPTNGNGHVEKKTQGGAASIMGDDIPEEVKGKVHDALSTGPATRQAVDTSSWEHLDAALAERVRHTPVFTRESLSQFDQVLLAHAGVGGEVFDEHGVHFSPAQFALLQRLTPEAQRDFWVHELAHLANPEATESEIRAEHPIALVQQELAATAADIDKIQGDGYIVHEDHGVVRMVTKDSHAENGTITIHRHSGARQIFQNQRGKKMQPAQTFAAEKLLAERAQRVYQPHLVPFLFALGWLRKQSKFKKSDFIDGMMEYVTFGKGGPEIFEKYRAVLREFWVATGIDPIREAAEFAEQWPPIPYISVYDAATVLDVWGPTTGVWHPVDVRLFYLHWLRTLGWLSLLSEDERRIRSLGFYYPSSDAQHSADWLTQKILALKTDRNADSVVSAILDRYADSFGTLVPWSEVDLIIPSPGRRGATHEVQIAQAMADRVHRPVVLSALSYVRDVATQKTVGGFVARFANQYQSMIADTSLVGGKTCVIVDDVAWTGGKLIEAMRAAYAAGAKRVYLVSLAGYPGEKTLETDIARIAIDDMVTKNPLGSFHPGRRAASEETFGRQRIQMADKARTVSVPELQISPRIDQTVRIKLPPTLEAKFKDRLTDGYLVITVPGPLTTQTLVDFLREEYEEEFRGKYRIRIGAGGLISDLDAPIGSNTLTLVADLGGASGNAFEKERYKSLQELLALTNLEEKTQLEIATSIPSLQPTQIETLLDKYKVAPDIQRRILALYSGQAQPSRASAGPALPLWIFQALGMEPGDFAALRNQWPNLTEGQRMEWQAELLRRILAFMKSSEDPRRVIGEAHSFVMAVFPAEPSGERQVIIVPNLGMAFANNNMRPALARLLLDALQDPRIARMVKVGPNRRTVLGAFMGAVGSRIFGFDPKSLFPFPFEMVESLFDAAKYQAEAAAWMRSQMKAILERWPSPGHLILSTDPEQAESFAQRSGISLEQAASFPRFAQQVNQTAWENIPPGEWKNVLDRHVMTSGITEHPYALGSSTNYFHPGTLNLMIQVERAGLRVIGSNILDSRKGAQATRLLLNRLQLDPVSNTGEKMLTFLADQVGKHISGLEGLPGAGSGMSLIVSRGANLLPTNPITDLVLRYGSQEITTYLSSPQFLDKLAQNFPQYADLVRPRIEQSPQKPEELPAEPTQKENAPSIQPEKPIEKQGPVQKSAQQLTGNEMNREAIEIVYTYLKGFLQYTLKTIQMESTAGTGLSRRAA